MTFWSIVRQRCWGLILVVAGVCIITFIISHLIPGDPARLLAGDRASDEIVQGIRQQLGLDQPLYIQFGRYVEALAHGDLGTSIRTGRPVAEDLKAFFPATLELAFCSLLLALVIGVPLGILIVRHKWLASPVLGIATIVLTIPSIALFGLMIPLFSLIGQGIGALPAITAVFLYSLLPIVRNTHTALDSLPPGLREAGRGIGMTFWQRLRWVEIPMALPVIFGGIRTAVVMNIGVMAIAAVIGAGGLGLLLLNGIGGSDIRMLIAGALMICLLAIVLDWLLHRLQVVLTPKGIR